jgi:hypothetical protein
MIYVISGVRKEDDGGYIPPYGVFLNAFNNVFKKYDGAVTVKWVGVNERTSRHSIIYRTNN